MGDRRGGTRTGPAFSTVPAELRDREVSVRTLLPLWQAVRAKGLDPERLAAGTGYAPSHLTNPRERVSWAAFVRFLGNLGALLDDDELVTLGASALESPVLRALLLPGRLLYTVSELYLWVLGPDGPASQLFVTHEGRIDELGPGHLRFETHQKPGYAPSRENYLLLCGSLRGLAQAFGAGPAQVSFELVPDGAVYDIRVPQAGGALGFVRRRVGWFLAARATADELRRANHELHQRYVELQREVAARHDAEAELRRVNEELERRVAERTDQLEAANRELAAFSYTVSHDLRAPLRAIDGFTAILEEDLADRLDGDGRALLARVRAAGRAMTRLIDDLIALAHFSHGEIHRTEVDLSALARDIASTLRHAAPARAVDVVVADGLIVRGDAGLLRIALQNLLANAWKYTGKHAHARIEVGVERGGGEPVYFVRDDGAGFDMAAASRLFEPFRRLHPASEFEGTGIGLATVARIVRRHGGRVWAEGRVEGGATIRFTLGQA